MKNLFYFVFLFVLSIQINAQNNALHFDGTTDYVSFTTPLLPTATASDAWTVEVKMKTANIVDDMLFTQYLPSLTNRAVIRIVPSGKISYWKGSLGVVAQTSDSYNDGLWHHIAVVKEGSGINQVHIYIDGVLSVSGTDNLPMANVVSELGRINLELQSRFGGVLDEVRIWNIARTQTEIDVNKDIEIVGTEIGLTAYYNFNQGIAYADNTGEATLNDATSNNNNGTLHTFSLNGSQSNWVGQYPQNDTCVTSTNITVSNTLFTQSLDEIVFSSMTNETLCADPNPQNYYDLWYDFTLPNDANVYIYGDNQSYNRFVLYDECLGTEIICFSNNKLLQLQSGINYKLRVFRKESERLFSSGNQTFTIQSFDQPVNDACVNAESITLTETLTTHNFDLRGATPDTEASCTVAGTYYDVWYDFTMPVTPSNLYIKGRQYGGNKYAIYDTCGGTEMACFNPTTTFYGSEILSNLTAGATYKLRVYRSAGNTAAPSGLIHNKFEIRTYPKIDNITCATAANIVVTTSNTNTTTNFGGASLINTQLGCYTYSDDYYDAWYTFVMPVSGNITIFSSAGTNNKYELFDACAGTSITCSSGNTTIQNLVAGNTYKLRVSRAEINVKFNPSDNNIFILKALAITNNDTCSNAENITVSETENTVNFEIISAQLNTEEGCSGSTPQSYADIWYKFTMPSFNGGSVTQGNVLIDGIAFTNKFAIYDACGGTEIDCFEDFKIVENLTSGTNYKIRVYRTAADYTSSNYKSFTIKAFSDAQNDECGSSENIGVTETVQTINFEFGGAQSNLETLCGTEYTYVDLWYDFTLADSGDLQITDTGFYDGFELFDACAGTQIGCFATTNGSFDNLVSGTNYKLRVFRPQNENQSSHKEFDIKVIYNNCGVDSIDPIAVTHNISVALDTFGIATITTSNINNNSTDNCSIASMSLDITSFNCSNLGVNTVNLTVVDTSGNSNTSSAIVTITAPLATFSSSGWDVTPNLGSKLVFDENFNTNSANIEACVCEISLGKTVVINSGDYLKIYGDIVNNGILEVQHQGSVVQVNDLATNTGSGIYKTHIQTTQLDDADRFTYFSSPSENETLQVFNAWANMSNTWDFNTATQQWHLLNGTETMQKGTGYAVRPATTNTFPFNGTVEFNGAFNNGVITKQLIYNVGGNDDDNNLVGNPYPSAIDATLLLNNNPGTNAFYFWTHQSILGATGYVSDDYSMWNNLGGTASASGSVEPSGYIASGQGFFVTATASGDFTFTNALRVNNNNTDFQRPTDTNEDKIWINLTNDENHFSQVLIGFTTNGTINFDPTFDAQRINSEAIVSFYTITQNSAHYGIETRPLLVEYTTIPLGISLLTNSTANFSFSIDHFENLENVSVYLKDHFNNITHNLSISDYSFTVSNVGEINSRFELFFSRSALSNIDNEVMQTELNVFNIDASTIGVTTKNNRLIEEVQIFNILGKLIAKKQSLKASLDINVNLHSGSIIFIKAKLQDGTMLHKKMIKF